MTNTSIHAGIRCQMNVRRSYFQCLREIECTRRLLISHTTKAWGSSSSARMISTTMASSKSSRRFGRGLAIVRCTSGASALLLTCVLSPYAGSLDIDVIGAYFNVIQSADVQPIFFFRSRAGARK
jgi:hypothetical protein